ncbi:hypothetical protein TBS_20140 [Thermobispora bispora]|uniref:DUF4177 domain-containing protein n=1 Tax=Thermobispora bispora (strain ATCC 19993 / DSM 43833 / CBS 139.67 / JCM 10125 / KCTC 9307 / NBRC 14880 / R51) TaxID=469371 RepID=D6Y2X2_THEBD|nr:DUF4177 domain-containing protein [Thermobispora bispora]MBO2475069.1 DUF4177 domain-containing protein [Actinomycetales bacterium]MDI9579262.1 DUF4177 domain-containing protein [Thermobispora sp.]ADG86933.1 hypothetical protein Tbis_0201 [Thermobispora bispora DSM 43833]MBX6166275.1 DUF4177 domain-containing protein [Thermobispora bispora]QSI46919.1 DUF4177 domain-containing protein [Thermobispora bispora]
MARWEYAVVGFDLGTYRGAQQVLDDWGSAGWELVTVIHLYNTEYNSSFVAFLKRRTG